MERSDRKFRLFRSRGFPSLAVELGVFDLVFRLLTETDNEVTEKLCWNDQWISPYESAWGIFEKFKYANNANSRDIMSLFGDEKVRNQKNKSKSKYDLLNFMKFDLNLIRDGLGIDFYHKNKIEIAHMLGPLTKKSYKNEPIYDYSFFFRDTIAYCPTCMENGFHSIFFQFKLIKKCPYHDILLLKECPACFAKIPYELSDLNTLEPFQCKCEYRFFKPQSKLLFSNEWVSSNLDRITCNNVNKYLNLTTGDMLRLKDMYLFKEIELDAYPNVLENIISILDFKDSQVEDNAHFIVTSAPNVKKIRGEKEKYEIQKYTKVNFPGINEEAIRKLRFHEFQKEIYQSYTATITGVAGQLRKTLLSKHRTCINRLIKNPNDKMQICPYAFAYVFWREYSQNFSNHTSVDNYGSPKRLVKNHIEFPQFDVEVMQNLYEFLGSDIEDITLESRAALKWFLNRVISHLSINHFNNMLSASQSYIDRRKFPSTLPYTKYDKIPFFVAIRPKDRNKPLEFHWWGQQLIISNLNCPFNTVKSKRAQS